MKEQSIGYDLEGLVAVQTFKPDFWINLGDIIYADVPITGGIGERRDSHHTPLGYDKGLTLVLA